MYWTDLCVLQNTLYIWELDFTYWWDENDFNMSCLFYWFTLMYNFNLELCQNLFFLMLAKRRCWIFCNLSPFTVEERYQNDLYFIASETKISLDPQVQTRREDHPLPWVLMTGESLPSTQKTEECPSQMTGGFPQWRVQIVDPWALAFHPLTPWSSDHRPHLTGDPLLQWTEGHHLLMIEG